MMDKDTEQALADALTEGRIQQQKDRKQEIVRRSRQTNWNGTDLDGMPSGTSRKSQPMMFGEGLGNQSGLDGPKYDTGWVRRPMETSADTIRREDRELAEELVEQEAKIERKQAGVAKARRTRERNLARKEAMKAQEEAGDVLVDIRVFVVSYAFGDWDKRAKAFGGIPEGVDIAHTPWDVNLLIVPVIEEAEGKALKLDEPMRDTLGRSFWITQEMKDQCSKVFGRVDWHRALTKGEAEEQFKVRIQA